MGQRWNCPTSGVAFPITHELIAIPKLTEADWLAWDRPFPLFHFFSRLEDRIRTETFHLGHEMQIGRKVKLFEAALSRKLEEWRLREGYDPLGQHGAYLLSFLYTWRPTRESVRDKMREACALVHEIFGNPFHPFTPHRSMLKWQDDMITKFARNIEERGAFEELPILADALEEAGCTDTYLLNHCREPKTHVPGCWALDALLGHGLKLRT
jgi:hypothetical protein